MDKHLVIQKCLSIFLLFYWTNSNILADNQTNNLLEFMEHISKEVARVVDFPENHENPFIPNLLIKKGNKNVVIAKSDKAIFSTSTGEVDGDTLFIGTKKELDKDQFVKIFHSHLQAIFDLSKASLKVFSYIASVTEYGDRIIFNLEDCKKYTGYNSKETIYKSLAELLKADIIARTDASNLFFINPQIFYKGDRIVLVNEYRKKRESQSVNISQKSLFDD
jgi:hypothetical protein